MKLYKITALFLLSLFVLTIVGCDKTEEAWDYENDSIRQPIEIPHEPYIPLDHEIRDISSWELIKEIKTGWNLGNTFESNGRGRNAEMTWGNPRTTFAMMKEIAKAGFDSVRIPITWQRQIGEAPSYLIDEDWLERVEEVVGYVLSNDMYCIINLHHEDWIIATEEGEKQTIEQLVTIWEQLCEKFKNYNEKLIFEIANEPRNIGCMYEWEGGSLEDRQIVNRLNQAVIDTIRNSGGRNELRHIMIPSYAASAEKVAMVSLADDFPHDDDKIIASIHAYVPYYFTLISHQYSESEDRWIPHVDEPIVDDLFDRFKENFLDRGIPVIIGETGARDKGDNIKDRVAWTKYYFGKARELGIPVFWWDNGKFSSDKLEYDDFGLLDRYEAKFVYSEIVKAIMGK